MLCICCALIPYLLLLCLLGIDEDVEHELMLQFGLYSLNLNGSYLRFPHYMSGEGTNMPLRMESVLEEISPMHTQSICKAYAELKLKGLLLELP